jgi:hypothetical protein
VVLVVGATETEPEVPEAENPVPEHEVALVEDHESVEDWPEVMEVGLAVREAVGAGGGGVYAARPSSPTHPSTPEVKSRFHQLKAVPFNTADVGPPITVATAPTTWVPRSVPAAV